MTGASAYGHLDYHRVGHASRRVGTSSRTHVGLSPDVESEDVESDTGRRVGHTSGYDVASSRTHTRVASSRTHIISAGNAFGTRRVGHNTSSRTHVESDTSSRTHIISDVESEDVESDTHHFSRTRRVGHTPFQQETPWAQDARHIRRTHTPFQTHQATSGGHTPRFPFVRGCWQEWTLARHTSSPTSRRVGHTSFQQEMPSAQDAMFHRLE